ncbi:MAG: glutamate--tRNA ligase [Candidatus Nanohaloarchaea archaeon]
MELEELARKYALKNAVEHGGECNPGAVIGKIFAEEEFDDKGKVTSVAQEVAEEVNSLSVEEQEEELENYEFDEQEQEHDPIPDLPGAEEGEVVVRFAPNPNGPPHIGHARGMVINGELRDKYSGKLILRYDDTDPVKKRPMKEAYEMYEEDYTWLGYTPDEVRYSSKNFDTYIEYAEKLIEDGHAYVCFCSQEEGSKHRAEGTACPHRDKSPEENMADWEKMRNGEISEGDATLKIKTDLDHKNPAVRDFVAFRIIDEPDHPVTGDEYRVWPLLDFQGAIEDHVMGTTHIVRGKDLRASTKRQKYIYDYLDWEYPEVRYWGNVRISGFEAPVSGSTLGKMIEEGELNGWDDPRAPTLRALKKRGFRPEAIQEFFIEMGVSENDIEASAETLESANRDLVEESDRYFFVRDPVELEVEDVPENVEPELPLHPDHPERGYRRPGLVRDGDTVKVYIEREDLEDGFLRLKGLCNIELSGKTAEYVEGDHTVAVEKDAPIIHWVSEAEDAEVHMPDGRTFQGLVEPNSIEKDEVVQFERFGFSRKESDGEYYYAHG